MFFYLHNYYDLFVNSADSIKIKFKDRVPGEFQVKSRLSKWLSVRSNELIPRSTTGVFPDIDGDYEQLMANNGLNFHNFLYLETIITCTNH